MNILYVVEELEQNVDVLLLDQDVYQPQYEGDQFLLQSRCLL